MTNLPNPLRLTVEDLTRQKVSDSHWLQIHSQFFMDVGIWALLESDHLAFVHRIRYEAKRLAEQEARGELEGEAK
jgi:hypothetical protein